MYCYDPYSNIFETCPSKATEFDIYDLKSLNARLTSMDACRSEIHNVRTSLVTCNYTHISTSAPAQPLRLSSDSRSSTKANTSMVFPYLHTPAYQSNLMGVSTQLILDCEHLHIYGTESILLQSQLYHTNQQTTTPYTTYHMLCTSPRF